MLPFVVVVNVEWYGECSRDELSLDSFPDTLYRERGRACSWCTVIKERSDVDLIKADESRCRWSIGSRVNRVEFKETKAGSRKDRVEVSLEVKM